MKFVAISFTLKGQSFEDIKLVLEKLSIMHNAVNGNVCLVHGFMPRALVIEKGFGTEVVDTLDKLFPYQMNCYVGGPQREVMASIIKEQRGLVYTIGEIKEGVAEELVAYEKATRFITRLPLGWDGVLNQVAPPPTEGEFRVRTSFNVTNSSTVDTLKQAGAAFIDLVDSINYGKELSPKESASFGRLKATAMTAIEEGTMWAVKAATI